jgi:hypothetical protein
LNECPKCKKIGYRYEGEPDEQGSYQLDYRHPDMRSYHWIICKIGRQIKEPKSNLNLDRNNPDCPYQKHLRALKQELELQPQLQPQRHPQLGEISLIEPKDFDRYEQHPTLLIKIANYWYDVASRLTDERNHARTEAMQLQDKVGELASKLSLYKRSSSGLRFVENENENRKLPERQKQKQKQKEKKSYASLEECQEYIRKHGIKTKRQYWEAGKKKDFPENFNKARPDHTYYVSWNELLGKAQ